MKRLIALFMAGLLLVSCSGTGPNTGNGTEPAETELSPDPTAPDDAAAETEEAKAEYPYETETLGGRTFTYLCCIDDLWGTDYWKIEQTELTGEAVHDAKYERNVRAETLLDMKLAFVRQGIFDLSAELIRAAAAGDSAYDAAYVSLNHYMNCAGATVNLRDVDSLHLEERWWDRAFIDSMTIGDRYLKASIDYTCLQSQKSCGVTWFNLDMITDYGLPSLYDAVREGSWTYDAMDSILGTVVNLNGDDAFTPAARGKHAVYGVVGQHEETPLFLIQGSGEFLVNKNEEGIPALIGDRSRLYDGFDRLASVLSEDGCCLLLNTAELCGYDLFWEGRAMFNVDQLSGATDNIVRESEIGYGILPVPKYNEEQSAYKTPTSQYTVAWTIPKSASDPSVSGRVAEVMNYYGWRDIRPEMITVMTYKGLRDEDSVEMLEIILDSHVSDIGQLSGWTTNLLNDIIHGMLDGNANAASLIAKNEKMIVKTIDKAVGKLD